MHSAAGTYEKNSSNESLVLNTGKIIYIIIVCTVCKSKSVKVSELFYPIVVIFSVDNVRASLCTESLIYTCLREKQYKTDKNSCNGGKVWENQVSPSINLIG